MEDPLTIYIGCLREAPIRLDLEITPEALDLSDEEYQIKDSVQADVTFRLIGETGVLASGTLRTQAESVCVRCLGPALVDLSCDVRETWIKGQEGNEASGDDIEGAPLVRGYSGDSFDVTEVFRELIMAELPSHPVCAPDCRGLCPGCGVNLNEEPCKCSPGEEEPIQKVAEPVWKQSLKKIHLEK